MVKNYFVAAWRNLIRNKVYSLINLAGLSLGLACVLLIVLYVKDEVSYDRFHKNADRLYRVVVGSRDPRAIGRPKMGITGFLQGPKFAAKLPGIEAFVRVVGSQMDLQTAGGVKSQALLYADSNFFSVFSFPLLSGDPRTALLQPHAVVVSEDAARKEFGTMDAVGKTLFGKDGNRFTAFTVTGVARRCPQNSSIKFEMLMPLKIAKDEENKISNWQSFFLSTYVVLKPAADRQAVEAGMLRVYREDAAPLIRAMESHDKTEDMGYFELQPFTAMHLGKDTSQENLSDASNPIFSYILSGIAVFILLIACINFINLTVARSLKRAKEIGIRKVMGGGRKQLMVQFLGEAFLLCFSAFAAALLLVQVLLPLFNRLSDKALSFFYLADIRLIAVYTGLLLVTGLVAGFYPALVISGFNPVRALYGRGSTGGSGFVGRNYLQKGLVILQFSLASFLIIGTLTIFSQFNYLTTRKLGYDDRGLVLVNKDGLTRGEAKLIKDELMKSPDILGVAAKDGGYSFTGATVNKDSGIGFAYVTVDESYIPLLKIPLVAGRNFSREFPLDSAHSVIVNETFAAKAGWGDPIGQEVKFGDKERYTVIGVVKDYHFESLSKKIDPELFTMTPGNDFGMVYIRLRPGPSSAALRYIGKTFTHLFPMSPYSYVFKDQENLRNYEAEKKWKQIILFAAALTIFISCIGLFGLSVLEAERRIREIGIRKVLGASVGSVVTILAKDFLKLVAVALLVAVPLSGLVAGKWLENYPYRIGLSGWLFGTAVLLVVVVALGTVSIQAIRAGLANPVKTLRNE